MTETIDHEVITARDLGLTIRLRREATGMSLSELSRLAGITPKALHLREEGQCVGAAEFWRVIYAMGYRITISKRTT